ncbi:hypothetical protein D3C81_1959670 [compost metagenome]
MNRRPQDGMLAHHHGQRVPESLQVKGLRGELVTKLVMIDGFFRAHSGVKDHALLNVA